MRVPRASVALSVLLALSACSSPPPPPSPQQVKAARQAALEAGAKPKLDMYQKLVAMKNYNLAVPIGQEIVDNFPHTHAAAEVNKTLPGIKAASAAQAEKSRLQDLWLYQVGPQSGGTQSTAAIRASRPAGSTVRLILRRHSSWGDSAYLYDQGGKGFVCKGQCDLHAKFDGKAHSFKGYLPNGGEPAMFIKNDKGFDADLKKAARITLEVTLKQGGRQTLEFEVGGFDPAKWMPLAKKHK